MPGRKEALCFGSGCPRKQSQVISHAQEVMSSCISGPFSLCATWTTEGAAHSSARLGFPFTVSLRATPEWSGTRPVLASSMYCFSSHVNQAKFFLQSVLKNPHQGHTCELRKGCLYEEGSCMGFFSICS